jgi:hypothetical protein
MKKYMLIILALGLALIGVWRITFSQNSTPNKLTSNKESRVSVDINPKTRDLGTVIFGDITETQFTLTNFTPDPLKITRVSTSCGCTSAKVEKNELQPYEETVIDVSFDPAVHKDDTDLGEVTRTIYIETANPDYPKLTVDIKAQVIKANK